MFAVSRFSVLACLILGFIALFAANNVLELRAEEPRRAIISMEMMWNGQYLIPQIQDWPYYNKPPLFNWVQVAFFKIFGSTKEWVLRFPSLVILCLTALGTYIFTAKWLNARTGFFAAFFLLTSADLLFYGSVNAGEMDLLFSGIIFFQLANIYHFHKKGNWTGLFLISYTLAALGTLCKGHAIVFQLLTLLPWLIYSKNWKRLFGWQHLLGLLIFFTIVLGYFYAYSFQGNAYGFAMNLIGEGAKKTAGTAGLGTTLLAAMSFPLFLMKLLLPWSLLALLFFQRSYRTKVRSLPVLQFLVLLIGLNLLVYWFNPLQKARYLYPLFPFICILLSDVLVNHASENLKKSIYRFFQAITLIVGLAILALPFIEELQVLDHLWLRAVSIAVAVGICFFLITKKWDHSLAIFIAFLLVLRIGFNLIYLPSLQANSKSLIYRANVDALLKITGSDSVHYYGKALDLNNGIHTAPLLAYQIPYYISRGNVNLMKIEEEIGANQFYMAHESLLKSMNIKEYYRFRDRFVKQDILLFKKQ